MPIMNTMLKSPTTSTTVIDIETAFEIVHSSWKIACKNIAKHADNKPVNQSNQFEYSILQYQMAHNTHTYNKRITIPKSSLWNLVDLIRLMYHFHLIFDAIDVSYKSNICFKKKQKFQS